MVRAFRAEALAELQAEAFDAIVGALELPDGSGLDFAREPVRDGVSTPLLLVAQDVSAALAVDAMRAGAKDLPVEPVEPASLIEALSTALRNAGHRELSKAADGEEAVDFLATSPVMKEVEALVRRVAASDATVLVRDESGTGKGVVARMLHELSSRRDKPFVKLHCSSIPEGLLESELFGHERGAFTGADRRELGRFEVAQGGTLFLAMVGRGEFREDMLYRLQVVPVWLPPLRARRDDIGALAEHFLDKRVRARGGPVVRFDPGALRILRRERWPGNVRQLGNFVERALVLAQGSVITEADVLADLGRVVEFRTQPVSVCDPAPQGAESANLGQARADAERVALERALAANSGNRAEAAKMLGISRRALYYKLKELGMR